MKEGYKLKADTWIDSAELKLSYIEKMMRGEKKADNNEALRYVQEIKKTLNDLKEIVSIS